MAAAIRKRRRFRYLGQIEKPVFHCAVSVVIKVIEINFVNNLHQRKPIGQQKSFAVVK